VKGQGQLSTNASNYIFAINGQLSTNASNYIFAINEEYWFDLYNMQPGSSEVKYVPNEQTDKGLIIGEIPFFRLACIIFGAPDNRSDKSGRFNLDNVVAEHFFEGNKSNVSLLSAHFTTYRENLQKQKGIARTLAHLGRLESSWRMSSRWMSRMSEVEGYGGLSELYLYIPID
jgi:hypothetical protein